MAVTAAPDRDHLQPLAIAQRIDDMSLRDLVLLAGRLVVELNTTSEAPGTKLNADRINGGKPTSRAPGHVTVCECNCASLADHHKARLAAAWEVDATAGGYPRRLRGAVLRAAQDLESARKAAQGVEDRDEDPAEREDRILADYVGMAADAAAALESARAGHVTPGAIRKARTRNGFSALDGRALPDEGAGGRRHSSAHESQQAWALELYYSGVTQVEIARTIGVAQSTVSRWVKPPAEAV